MPITPETRKESLFLKGRRSRAIVGLLLVAILTSACAEDSTGPEDDRRFANEEVTSVATEVVQRDPTVPGQAPTATSPGSGEALLSAELAPSNIVFQEGDELRIVSINDPMTATSIAAGEGERIVDFVASPDGTQVAVLVIGGEQDDIEPSLLLFNEAGIEQARWSLAEWVDAPSIATPDAAAGTDGAGSVSWSAGQDRLLVTLFGKALLNVDVDGEVEEILVTSRAGTLVDAAWSPTSKQIALKTRNGSGSGTVWVFNPSIDGDSFKQVIPPPADASNLGSVTEVRWLPNGEGLAYILAQDASDGSRGGQLYVIDLATRERRVVATPGRGGPSAQITDFTVSPDGASVAYTIEEPVDGGWKFHSLWIRSIDSALFIDLPAARAESVGNYWWIGDGFAWQYTTDQTHGVAFMRAGSDPGLLWAPEQPGGGTPQASPVAIRNEGTPVSATPVVGTPIATPGMATPSAIATPGMATPSASPVASSPQG